MRFNDNVAVQGCFSEPETDTRSLQFPLELTRTTVEKLWNEAEIFTNHPRVRLAEHHGTKITIHKDRNATKHIRESLSSHPGLRKMAGLRYCDESYYVMTFVGGKGLHEAQSDRDYAEELALSLMSLWQLPVRDTGPARPERPVLAPVTRAQYISMPEDVIATASHYRELIRGLSEELSQRRNPTSLIHGDLKADNIILTPSRQIKFIDWECCGLGDPADDLASLFASQSIYAVVRAVHQARNADTAKTALEADLEDRVAAELTLTQEMSRSVLKALANYGVQVDMEVLGRATLLSLLCRLQGLQFISTSQSVHLIAATFVKRAAEYGGPALATWLSEDGSGAFE